MLYSGNKLTVEANGKSFSICDINPEEVFFELTPTVEIDSRKDSNVSFEQKDNCLIWTAEDSVFQKRYVLEFNKDYAFFRTFIKGTGTFERVDYFKGTNFNTSGYYSPIVGNKGDVGIHKPMTTSDNLRNSFFTPPPQMYVYDMEGNDNFVSIGAVAREGEHNFTYFEYVNDDSRCHWSLFYGNYTHIDGEYELPGILFMVNSDKYELYKGYSDFYFDKGYCRKGVHKRHSWWSGNILCGWGDQWSIGAKMSGEAKSNWDEDAIKDNADKTPVLSAFDYAISVSDEETYEGIIARTEAKGINFSTVIIDCKWHKEYGTMEVDTAKWKDLRGFIDKQHSLGRRVLLWYNFWSVEGLDADECITCDGEKLYTDPTNPKYIARLEKIMERLLGSGENSFDADGFKVDFVEIPKEKELEVYQKGVFGIELVKRNMSLVYNLAKKVKEEALISSQHVHPYFDDCMDMMRIGDYYCLNNAPITNLDTRINMLKATLPDILIDIDAAGGSKKRDALLYFEKGASMGGVLSLYGTLMYDVMFNEEDWERVRTVFNNK